MGKSLVSCFLRHSVLQPFNDLFSTTVWISRYQKGKTSLDLSEARIDGVLQRQWHQLDHMQTVCTSLQTDNHANTSSVNFFGTTEAPLCYFVHNPAIIAAVTQTHGDGQWSRLQSRCSRWSWFRGFLATLLTTTGQVANSSPRMESRPTCRPISLNNREKFMNR